MLSSLALCFVLVPQDVPRDNVLLILADDIGVDRVACYAEHPDPGRTPVLDRLAAEGLLFRNAWSYPTCSPARAALLTGRHGFRTGIGVATEPDGGQRGLSISEITLPELLAQESGGQISTACLGKWHLAASAKAVTHPLDSGFGTYAGCLFNVPSYYRWPKTMGGRSRLNRTYATTDTTDDAIETVRSLQEPWFLFVSFNAAHHPLHTPPEDLHGYGELGPGTAPSRRFQATVEALDTEIGRLLDSLPETIAARTTVLFAGDNGTPAQLTTAPFSESHAKKTVYEGGVNVPLIVRGPRVVEPGRECQALVSLTDLFATAAELQQVDAHAALGADVALDSVSLVPYFEDPTHAPLREYVYTERFSPNGMGPYEFHESAIRDARWKLITRSSRSGLARELYDLRRDPFETRNLLALEPQTATRDALRRLRRALPAE